MLKRLYVLFALATVMLAIPDDAQAQRCAKCTTSCGALSWECSENCYEGPISNPQDDACYMAGDDCILVDFRDEDESCPGLMTLAQAFSVAPSGTVISPIVSQLRIGDLLQLKSCSGALIAAVMPKAEENRTRAALRRISL